MLCDNCKNKEICRYFSTCKEIYNKILDIPYSKPFNIYIKCEYCESIKTTREV